MNGTADRRGFQMTPQVFVGLALVLIGTLFALDTLGIAHTERYIGLWPALLIGLGLVKLVQARGGPGLVAAGFWIAIGSWMLADNLGYEVPDFWEAWPALLVLVGLALIWQALRGPRPETPAGRDNRLSTIAVMAGVVRRPSSKSFIGGEVTAVMGGCEIDLRDAALAPEGATIETFAFWGGIEIRVPQGWRIDNRVFAVMGAAEDSTKSSAPADAPRLTLRGFVLMGGVEIKN